MYDTNISAEYPFKSHYIDILGSKIHYIEQGKGDPVLFLHGMPSWSYLWRNIIPHVSPYARCIALDLIGHGRSEQPDIEYSVADHIKYVEEFIKKLQLHNIIFIGHSYGSLFALHYASHHEKNVKGMAFMEPLFMPFASWEDFHPTKPIMMETFKKFRTPKLGWELIVNQDVFIDRIGSGGNQRQLTEQERKFYREPFDPPRNRLPMWRAPQELPIAGEPANVVAIVNQYNQWLQKTNLPILLFHVDTGGFMTSKTLSWCKAHLKNLTTKDLEAGAYWYMEDYPHTIGNEIMNWYQKINSRGK